MSFVKCYIMTCKSVLDGTNTPKHFISLGRFTVSSFPVTWPSSIATFLELPLECPLAKSRTPLFKMHRSSLNSVIEREIHMESIGDYGQCIVYLYQFNFLLSS